MQLLSTLAICFLFALSFLVGCHTTQVAPDAVSLQVSAGWDGVKHCTGGKRVYYPSPRFEIRNIPAGTRFLRFNLYHFDANDNHGTDDVSYEGGSVVPAGAFEYLGPCPNPARVPGAYDWTVIALDGEKKIELGRGKLRLLFPR